MTKNLIIDKKTAADVNKQIHRILRDLGYPEPPLDMRFVFELLKLDKQYYSSMDPGWIDTVMSRIKIGGHQLLLRPTLFFDALTKLGIKALYMPDKKRILIDESQPVLKL